MMAPAMAERRPEEVTYRELGERDAVLARTLEAGMLPRLGELGAIISPAAVNLDFSLVDRRPGVSGKASVRMKLPCQWCERFLERDVSAEFSVLLAVDDDQANRWDEEVGSRHVIVTAGDHLDVVSLVEDELLLSVPSRVCTDEQCPWRPGDEAGEGDPGTDQERQSPFAGIADLLRK
jgi:uncharacterized metal-binding protein YceD (DUF177 family)